MNTVTVGVDWPNGDRELLAWCWRNIEGTGMVLLPRREVKPDCTWTMRYLPAEAFVGRQVEFNFVRGADATMFSLRWT